MVVNVVWGYSAAGALYDAGIKGKVVAMRDDLTVGPLREVNSCGYRHLRMSWLRNVYRHQINKYGGHVVDGVDDSDRVNQLQRSSEQIVIWFGRCAVEELCAMSLLSEIGFKKRLVLAQCHRKIPIGSLRREDVERVYKKRVAAGKRLLRDITRKWYAILQSGAVVRLRIGRFRYRPRTQVSFDRAIVKIAGKAKMKTCELLYRVIRYYGANSPGEEYVIWRIRNLVHRKALLCDRHGCFRDSYVYASPRGSELA